MLRVFRYRLYPTTAQNTALRETLDRLRELYNAALQERRDAYRKQGITLSAYGQMAELRGVREDFSSIHTHRPLEGTLQQVSVTLDGSGHWYAAMVCRDVRRKVLPGTGQTVGVDVGITTFATLSTGEEVRSPRPYRAVQARVRTAQQRVARKRNKRSNRRRKAVALLGVQHAKVERIRRDFHHEAASNLVLQFDTIKVEELNIKGLAAGMLAKHVHDAGWGQFIEILAGKAESAGRELIKVDPRGTSQECSRCGAVVRKSLAVRVHACPECGLVLGRDHNAAINIEKRPGHGRRGRGAQWHDPLIPRSPFLTPLA